MQFFHNIFLFVALGLINCTTLVPKNQAICKYYFFIKIEQSWTRTKKLKRFVIQHLPNSKIKDLLLIKLSNIEQALQNLKIITPLQETLQNSFVNQSLLTLKKINVKIENLENIVKNLIEHFTRGLQPQLNTELNKPKIFAKTVNKKLDFANCNINKIVKEALKAVGAAVITKTTEAAYNKITEPAAPYVKDEDDIVDWIDEEETHKKWRSLKANTAPTRESFQEEAMYWNEQCQILIKINKDKIVLKQSMLETRQRRASEKNLKLKEKLEECKKLQDLEKNLQEKKELHKNMLSDKTIMIQELSKKATTAQAELVEIKNLLEEKRAIKNSNDLLKNDIKNLTEEIHKLENKLV